MKNIVIIISLISGLLASGCQAPVTVTAISTVSAVNNTAFSREGTGTAGQETGRIIVIHQSKAQEPEELPSFMKAKIRN